LLNPSSDPCRMAVRWGFLLSGTDQPPIAVIAPRMTPAIRYADNDTSCHVLPEQLHIRNNAAVFGGYVKRTSVVVLTCANSAHPVRSI
jgi:hypothetical protein